MLRQAEMSRYVCMSSPDTVHAELGALRIFGLAAHVGLGV